jgi:hypothetical protein
VQGIILRCSCDNVSVCEVTYMKSEYYASAGGLEESPGTLNRVTGTLLASGIVGAVKIPLS